MKRFLSTQFFILLLALPILGQEIHQQIDQLLRAYHQKQAFSGSVLVAKSGTILFEGSYGFANRKKNLANHISHQYLIGSTTKSFTAIAVLQLWEKGLLDLHVPIGKYLPELKDDLGRLTLHHLMKNSSGLPVHLNRITELKYSDISSDEIIQLYNTCQLSFEAGEQFEYSNLNYQLCAIIVEKVSGQSFKKYIEEHILKPSGMFSSGVARTYTDLPNLALGYTVENGRFTEATKNYLAYAMGGGDMYATAEDLLQWDQALYQEKLLGRKAKALLFDGDPTQFAGYGYGFKIKYYERSKGKRKGKLVRHGGSMYGYIANVHRYLEDQVCIIILGNIRPYPTMEITNAIEAILRETNFL